MPPLASAAASIRPNTTEGALSEFFTPAWMIVICGSVSTTLGSGVAAAAGAGGTAGAAAIAGPASATGAAAGSAASSAVSAAAGSSAGGALATSMAAAS